MNRVLITYRDVEAMTGFKRAYFYREMERGQFPLPVKVGRKSVRWVESEIREWTEDRIREDRERRAVQATES
jgi:prophage regulatory protein